MINDRAIFHVSVHDVTPQQLGALTIILDKLAPLIQDHAAAAVVPSWRGQSIAGAEAEFLAFVNGSFKEILMHGYSHYRERGRDLLSVLTGRSNEFSGLPVLQAKARLQEGQTVLAKTFGQLASGFVPPAWQRGAITPQLLAECQFQFCVGMTGIECEDGRRIPLSTWSWDAGIVAPLGYLTEAAGTAMFLNHTASIPNIVFHPADVERGYLKRGLRLVKRFLAEGRQPVSFRHIVSNQGIP